MALTEEQQKRLRLLELKAKASAAAGNAPQAEQGPAPNPTEAGLSGVNIGLAQMAGAPVDLANEALSFATGGRLRASEPLLGSKSIQKALENAGAIRKGISRETARNQAEQIALTAGETFGASVIPGAGALGAARAGAGLSIPIIREAAKRPGAFLAAETAASGGAAQGAGIAEAVAPGDEGARLAGEVIGGFVSPTSLVARGTDAAVGGARNLASIFSPQARQTAAGKSIRAVIEEAGEDPDVVLSALQAPSAVSANLTSATKSGSEGLRALENMARAKSARFGIEADKQTTAGLQEVRETAQRLYDTGDPAAIRAAAAVRQRYFDDLLASNIRAAETELAEASAGLVRRPGAAAEAGSKTYQTLDRALQSSRAVERELWSKAPQDAAIPDISPLKESLRELRGRLLPTEPSPLPGPVQAMTRRFGRAERAEARLYKVLTQLEGGKVSPERAARLQSLATQLETVAEANRPRVGDLTKMRTRVMELSSEARAAQRFSEASALDLVADGLLESLNRADVPGLDEARAFSRALNDNFTRSFAGQALRTSSNGAERIAPETLLERAFAGRGAAPAVRFRELEEAARFGDQGGNPVFANAVRNEQEAFLRDAAGALFDEAGNVSPQRLRTFVDANREVLRRFPELAKELVSVDRATKALRGAQELEKTASRALKEKTVFSRLMGSEDASRVVADALSGRNPSREIQQMAKLAKRSGPNAVSGLKVSIIDTAESAARKSDGIDYQIFLDDLYTRRGNTPSKAELMLNNDVAKPDELKRLQTLLEEGARIQKGASTLGASGDFIEPTSALVDFAIRTGGARLGAKVSTGPSTLVAAGAGSRFMRQILEKIPATRTTDLLIEAARDPKVAADLIKKTSSEREKLAIAKRLNGFLISSGIIFADGEGESNVADE